MHSSDPRNYARFIPAEELGNVAHWRFGTVGAAYSPDELDRRQEEAVQAQLQLESASLSAFERGLAQGRAEAKLEGEIEAQRLLQEYIDNQGQAAAEQLSAVVEHAHETLQAAQVTMAQGVLDLACAVARQVIRHELTLDKTAIRHVIKEALDTVLEDGKTATVRIHPEDMDMLQAPLERTLAGASFALVADASIAPGDCRVECAGAVIDGSLQTRWHRAVAALGLPPERASFDIEDPGPTESAP